MKWQEWKDELGRCYVCGPYVVREHAVLSGIVYWRLDGNGMTPEESRDPELLKLSAERHARSQRIPVP
jgi:hypothetical protein